MSSPPGTAAAPTHRKRSSLSTFLGGGKGHSGPFSLSRLVTHAHKKSGSGSSAKPLSVARDESQSQAPSVTSPKKSRLSWLRSGIQFKSATTSMAPMASVTHAIVLAEGQSQANILQVEGVDGSVAVKTIESLQRDSRDSLHRLDASLLAEVELPEQKRVDAPAVKDGETDKVVLREILEDILGHPNTEFLEPSARRQSLMASPSVPEIIRASMSDVTDPPPSSPTSPLSSPLAHLPTPSVAHPTIPSSPLSFEGAELSKPMVVDGSTEASGSAGAKPLPGVGKRTLDTVREETKSEAEEETATIRTKRTRTSLPAGFAPDATESSFNVQSKSLRRSKTISSGIVHSTSAASSLGGGVTTRAKARREADSVKRVTRSMSDSPMSSSSSASPVKPASPRKSRKKGVQQQSLFSAAAKARIHPVPIYKFSLSGHDDAEIHLGDVSAGWSASEHDGEPVSPSIVTLKENDAVSEHRSAFYSAIQEMRASHSDDQLQPSHGQRTAAHAKQFTLPPVQLRRSNTSPSSSAESPLASAINSIANSPLARFGGRSKSFDESARSLMDGLGIEPTFIHSRVESAVQSTTTVVSPSTPSRGRQGFKGITSIKQTEEDEDSMQIDFEPPLASTSTINTRARSRACKSIENTDSVELDASPVKTTRAASVSINVGLQLQAKRPSGPRPASSRRAGTGEVTPKRGSRASTGV